MRSPQPISGDLEDDHACSFVSSTISRSMTPHFLVHVWDRKRQASELARLETRRATAGRYRGSIPFIDQFPTPGLLDHGTGDAEPRPRIPRRGDLLIREPAQRSSAPFPAAGEPLAE